MKIIAANKKANFDYALSNSDIIVIEGDLESV